MFRPGFLRRLAVIQVPEDAQRIVASLAPDQSALFQRLNRVARRGQRAYGFAAFRLPQQQIAAERVCFQRIAIL
jgi:hypothetical protein